MKRLSRLIGVTLIGAAVVLIGTVAYYNSQKRQVPIVFSPRAMLDALWGTYKKEYISNGRAIDRQRGDITTSEGQSYSMLRAVWLDDRSSFDESWEWTKTNLKRSDDHLFAWM